QLDRYRQITANRRDPRKLTEAQAKQLIATGKPIYFASGSIHSPETGSPEMLMELAYQLPVENSALCRRVAIHPNHSQQHYFRVYACERGRWTREAGGQLHRAAKRTAGTINGVLGEIRPARQQSRRHR